MDVIKHSSIFSPLRKAMKRIMKDGSSTGTVSYGDEDSDVMTSASPRYLPCQDLIGAGIPCCIWGEDILAYYGVPTILFDLFLLVPEPLEAMRILVDLGYTRTKPNQRYRSLPEFSNPNVPRLLQPGVGDSVVPVPSPGNDLPDADDRKASGVVLLPVAAWTYLLPQTTAEISQLSPSLSDYFNAIAEKWLDLAEDNEKLRLHLAVHLEYIVAYLDEPWKPEFENEVKQEHRQLYYDMMAQDGFASDFGDLECQKHHRQMKSKILSGRLIAPSVKTLQRRKAPEQVGTRVVMTVPNPPLPEQRSNNWMPTGLFGK